LLEASSISDDGNDPKESLDGEAQSDSPRRPSTATQAASYNTANQEHNGDYQFSANSASGFQLSPQDQASSFQVPFQVERDQDEHTAPAHVAWDGLLRGIEELESPLDCTTKSAIRSQLVAASARQR
jgi:hypothetical protein